MKDSKFRQLTLEGSFIFLFLRNIQQDALPVERLSLLVANEICIFLDPDSGAIPSDQPIFFQKTGTAAIAFVVSLYNSFTIIRMNRRGPQIWIGRPFLCRIACQFLYARTHVKSGLPVISLI